MEILDYKYIMGLDPTTYNDKPFFNALGQEIWFMEHPILGDLYPVLVHFPKEKVVACSDFFETDDMIAEHGEYAPVLIDGKVDCQFHHDIFPNKIPKCYRHLLKKDRYRVQAKVISYVYLDVDADSEVEAIQIADATDGGDFTPTTEGDFEIIEANIIE